MGTEFKAILSSVARVGSFGATGNSDLPERRKEGKGRSLTDLEGKGKVKENAQILPPRLQDFKPVYLLFLSVMCITHICMFRPSTSSVSSSGFFPLIPV